MTKAPHTLTSLLHRLGVAGPARVRVVKGGGAPRITALAVLLAVAAMLALSAAPALGAVSNRFEFSFDGEETPGWGGEASAAAVDVSGGVSAGDVYVVSQSQFVDKFTASGKFLCQITGAAGSASAPASECGASNSSRLGPEGGSFVGQGGVSGVAVDPATGDLYVVDTPRGVIDRFSPEGEYETQITGLSAPHGVAVSKTDGEVYIAQNGAFGGESVVERFDPSTSTLSTFAAGTGSGPFGSLEGLAVDNSSGPSSGDVYLVDAGNKVVDKFTSGGVEEPQLTRTPEGSFGTPIQVAVDPTSGVVYVSDLEREVVDGFDASGAWVEQLTTSGGTRAVAVSAAGRLYVSFTGLVDNEPRGVVDVFGRGVLVPDVRTGAVSDVGAASATVEGSVNPDGVALSDCRVEYGTTTFYDRSASCEPPAASIAADRSFHTVTASLTELSPGTQYHYRLEAANGDGVRSLGLDATFSTLPAPSIDSATASNLTAETADLNAQINPNGYDTHYRFEWGTTTAYGFHAPATFEDIGAGTGDVGRSVHISELEANTTYHWRVVATNANGTVGEDHTFVYDTAGAALPDARRYEMVSPPHKNAALLGVALLSLFPEVSPDGSRLMTTAVQCFAGAGSCMGLYGGRLGSAYALSRTSTGWLPTALSPAATEFPVNAMRAFSAGTGSALYTVPSSSGTVENERFYARNSANGAFAEIGPVSPVFPAGTPDAVYATEDDSHVLWEAPPSWPLDETVSATSSTTSLYEYSGLDNTQPLLVGVTGGQHSTSLVSVCGTHATPGEQRPGVLSADGRAVFFTAVKCKAGSGTNSETRVPADEVYARLDGEGPEARTVPLSRPSPSECGSVCQTSAPSNATFVGAAANGSNAFFTTAQQLTDAATSGQTNLYLYDFSNPRGHNLIDVSAGDPAGPGVQGVTALSPDGSHVYFVATGALTPKPNGQGQQALEGAENLYVYERDATQPNGRLTFIATLSSADHNEFARPSPLLAANVTPEGRFLVFTSHARLTADDTSLSGAAQVFRYDAQTGALSRISVGNGGFGDSGNRSGPTQCAGLAGACSEDAHIVPSEQRPRRDPTMSDDGSRVFFQSPVGLTPHAIDDVSVGTDTSSQQVVYAQNVYEWEQEGVGSCPAGRAAGCVFLISDGRDVSRDAGQIAEYCGLSGGFSAVCLLGTDTTGSNAFFTTVDSLVPSDTDTQLDYYDARVCSAASACIEPTAPALPPCQGEVCHGTPAGTPPPPVAPSMTFNGQGNLTPPTPVPVRPKTAAQFRAQKLAKALKACHAKHDKHKRAACERQARKRYGHTNAKKASHTTTTRKEGK
jgi:hypothetical protein